MRSDRQKRKRKNKRIKIKANKIRRKKIGSAHRKTERILDEAQRRLDKIKTRMANETKDGIESDDRDEIKESGRMKQNIGFERSAFKFVEEDEEIRAEKSKQEFDKSAWKT